MAQPVKPHNGRRGAGTVIIGAGPAGLTAAYELVKSGFQPLVLEKTNKVGGIARTECYKGYRFDMGGHRFYTKSHAVRVMWEEILGKDFLQRPRLSRIYFNGRFFHYPLRPMNVLKNLGILEAILIGLSYVRWQIRPYPTDDTFEQWVTNRFGRRLFLTFFKTYTEKVWGISCGELKGEWAAQRIKDLSLRTVFLRMLGTERRTIRSLIEEFAYPRLGPGMMWEAVQRQIESGGGTVSLNTEVLHLNREGSVIRSVTVKRQGQTEIIPVSHVMSSMPVTEAVMKIAPSEDFTVRSAAHRLRYRDFLTVCLIIDRQHLFPDNWIYVHDPSVKVGRIQNFKNWSPEMVPNPMKSSLGLEYFCQEGDELWSASDADLIQRGKREVAHLGLARYEEIEDGCVFRIPKAYPVYDEQYREALDAIRTYVNGVTNFQTLGRNGLHRYNNQDHSMLTGMLAVENLLQHEQHDLWNVNADTEYQEEQRVTPDRVSESRL
ncbi:NAD(P)/FAD-dependent oxidoreductase [Nitrospira sp. Nam74]